MSAVLVLIDFQNDYFPGGAMEVQGADSAVARAAELLRAWRYRKLPVVHVQHLASRPDATFLCPGTPGAEIHPEVSPLPSEPVVQKASPNAFRGTDLEQVLRDHGAESLVVAGMMTHMCVDTTVRAASDLGFAVRLAADATATRPLAFNGLLVPPEHVQAAYLAGLMSFAEVVPTATILG